jgi:hypothetical protein
VPCCASRALVSPAGLLSGDIRAGFRASSTRGNLPSLPLLGFFQQSQIDRVRITRFSSLFLSISLCSFGHVTASDTCPLAGTSPSGHTSSLPFLTYSSRQCPAERQRLVIITVPSMLPCRRSHFMANNSGRLSPAVGIMKTVSQTRNESHAPSLTRSCSVPNVTPNVAFPARAWPPSRTLST